MRDVIALSNFYAGQIYKFLIDDMKGLNTHINTNCNLDIESDILNTVMDIYHRDKWDLILTGIIADLLVGNNSRSIEALGYELVGESNRFHRVTPQYFKHFGSAFGLSNFMVYPCADVDVYISAVNSAKIGNGIDDFDDNSEDFENLNNDSDIDDFNDSFVSSQDSRHIMSGQCFKAFDSILKGFVSINRELKLRSGDLRETALKRTATITSAELEAAIKQVQLYNEHLDMLQDWRLQMISKLNLISCSQFKLVRYKDVRPGDLGASEDVSNILFNCMQNLLVFNARYALRGLQGLSSQLYSPVKSNHSMKQQSKSSNEDLDTHLF